MKEKIITEIVNALNSMGEAEIVPLWNRYAVQCKKYKPCIGRTEEIASDFRGSSENEIKSLIGHYDSSDTWYRYDAEHADVSTFSSLSNELSPYNAEALAKYIAGHKKLFREYIQK